MITKKQAFKIISLIHIIKLELIKATEFVSWKHYANIQHTQKDHFVCFVKFVFRCLDNGLPMTVMGFSLLVKRPCVKTEIILSFYLDIESTSLWNAIKQELELLV